MTRECGDGVLTVRAGAPAKARAGTRRRRPSSARSWSSRGLRRP